MSRHKVMLLGEIGVGKSSLVRRLVLDRFESNYKPTIGVDIYTYEVPPAKIGGPTTTLLIWDTDGNFGESMFRHVYMRQAHAALIVGDATRPATLNTMANLADGFRDNFPGRHQSLIINKIDLIEHNQLIEIPKTVTDANVAVMRTSAKTGKNVQSAFHNAAETILRREG